MSDTNKTENIMQSILDTCLNILRTDEYIVGEKALANINKILILKLIEPKFDELNIINYNYDLDYIEDIDERNDIKERCLNYIKFSNLVNYDKCYISLLKEIWEHIISNYNILKLLFENELTITKSKTIKKLLLKINELDKIDEDYDLLGDCYQNVIKDLMTGKVLGQFFTPPNIKNVMISLIKPKINEDGTIKSICDPTMGTGGFLLSYIKELKKQAKEQNIKLDWNYINNEVIYGKELDVDTHQLGISNLLISTGHYFNNLYIGDTLDEPIREKFDIIMANPPFGIKGLKYEDYKFDIKEEYLPIKTNNAIMLFLQAIIYMLKVNGKCAIVLPKGQELFSRNKTFAKIRKYLMETCNLKKIISFPSKTFEYTAIETCVLYFVKKCEKEDIDGLKTNNIKFYNYSNITNEYDLIAEASQEQIIENHYILISKTYIVKEIKEYNNIIEWKKLGDICDIFQGTMLNKSNIISGEYEVIGGGKVIGKHNNFNRYNDEITITRVGDINIKYMNNKYYLTDNAFAFKSNNKDINTQYIYYYLYYNIDLLKEYYTGTAQQVISKTNLKNIKIPIPCYNKQLDLIEYFELLEHNIKLNKSKMIEYEKFNKVEIKFNLREDYMNYVIDRKKLGDICDINYGERVVKKNIEEGEYYVYGGGDKTFKINKYNRDGYNIIISRFGLSEKCVRLINGKIFLNDSGLTVKSKNINILLDKYLGYYLYYNQDIIYNLSSGTAQLNLNMLNFKDINIPIPSFEYQLELINYYDNYDNYLSKINYLKEENINLAKKGKEIILII